MENKDWQERLDSLETRLDHKLDALNKQMALLIENVNELKCRVLDPDKGLYSRVKDLETWVATKTKKEEKVDKFIFGLTSTAIIMILKELVSLLG